MSWLYPFANTARRHSSGSHSKDRRDRHYSSSSRHSSSAPSLFSLGPSANRSSASSIFSGVSGMSSSSRGGYHSHRAKPRSGFISRMIRKIKRLFRKLVYYAKKHPARVFFMVVLPLITGGVLQKLLGTVGIRLPASLQAAAGGSKDLGGGDWSSLAGGGGGVSGLVSLAKMFV